MMADDWGFRHGERRERANQTAKRCFRCDVVGHIARHCPTRKDTRTCYNCGEEGHISRDCTNRRRTKQECYRCGEVGHLARDCPNQEIKVCYKCHEEGHISRDCINGEDRERYSHRGRQAGHFVNDRPRKTDSPLIACHNCGERSHISRDCPQKQKCDKTEDRESSIKRNAEELKRKGNIYYTEKNYGEAVKCYTRAISLSPHCSVYYGNRSACYMKLNKYTEALDDAMESVRHDPKFIKGYLREAKCHMELGDSAAAMMSYRKVFQLEPNNKEDKEAKDGLQIAKRQHLTKRLLALKEEGNRSFHAGNYEKAFTIYTEALTIDPDNKIINSQLYMNRGTVCSMIGKKNEAIDDLTKAIKLNDSYLKAYFRRAKCYMEMKKYQEAVNDYEKVCQMDCTSENKRLLEEAQSALKKSNNKDSRTDSSKDSSKDFYKVLGVPRYATDDEIKKAYKKKALSHHPDRHSRNTVQVQKKEEIKFKEVGEAFAVLSCPMKRMRYNLEHPADFREYDSRDRDDPFFENLFGGRRPSQQFPFGGGGRTYTGGFPTWL